MMKIILTVLDTLHCTMETPIKDLLRLHRQLNKKNLLTILEEEGVHGFFEKLPNIQQKKAGYKIEDDIMAVLGYFPSGYATDHESIKEIIFSIICESFHEILLFKKEFPSQNELELVIKIEVFLSDLNNRVKDKNFTLEKFLFFGKASLNFANNLGVGHSFIENCKISIEKHLLMTGQKMLLEWY